MEKTEREIEAEVAKRLLTAYYWDGELHSLPHDLAEKHADFIAELKRRQPNFTEEQLRAMKGDGSL